MRLKNIPGAGEYIEKSHYVIQNPEKIKSNWNNEFKNTNPIHIEIGMGRGDFIIKMAINHPEINYIGIEMYDSVIFKAVKKLEKLENAPVNLRIIRMDATEINSVFEKEISRIYLNFSDPWPKAKHAKRRLTSPQFLERYTSIFKGEQQIFQKTDNDSLFSYSIESFKEAGFRLENVTYDLYNNMIEENVQTEYESKFVEKGTKIKRLEAYKTNY